MLGVDELISGIGAEIIDVFDEKGVGGWVMSEQQDLGSSRSKRSSDSGTNA